MKMSVLRIGLMTLAAGVLLPACSPEEEQTSPTPASFDDSTPRCSPNGKEIVFVRDRAGDSDIYVMDLEDGRSRMLVDASTFDVDPVFSPDGSGILFETSPDGYAQLHLVPSFGGDIEPISDVLDGWATFPAWSPDGRTIVYSCGRPMYPKSDLCLLSRSGEFLGLLGEESASQELEPAWSPDGSTVAFASNRSGDSDVYLIDIESARVTRLTVGSGQEGDPAWSPDGKTIAFTSSRGGAAQICLMLADGSGVHCLTEGVQPSWSPDGASLAFYRMTPQGTRIFFMGLDGTAITQVT